MIKYSIIIPHKNLVYLLKRCLQSIPEKDEIQIIVVDYNSTPDNLSILKKYSRSNVELIYTDEDRGAGHARNIGLKYAKGKWLLFCDADDYFNENFLKYLNRYYDSIYDVIFWGFKTVDSDTGEIKPSRVIGYDKAMNNNDIDYFKYRFHGPWAKMIRKTLVDNNHITFDETICSNDTFFSGKIGFYSKKAILDSAQIYVTVVRQGSLVHSMNVQTLSTRIEVSLKYNKFLREIKYNKYRINMISLIYYLRKIDKNMFFKYLKLYYKQESIYNISIDLSKSISGLLRHLFFSKSNMRKYIEIKK